MTSKERTETNEDAAVLARDKSAQFDHRLWTFTFPALHNGVNPRGVVLVAEPVGEKGIFQEIAITAVLGDKRIADITVGIDETGEVRALITSDGDGDGDHPISVYPERSKLNAIKRILDGD